MSRFGSLLLLLFAAGFIGCSSGETTNVGADASADDIAEYERMIQEAEEADNAAGESE